MTRDRDESSGRTSTSPAPRIDEAIPSALKPGLRYTNADTQSSGDEKDQYSLDGENSDWEWTYPPSLFPTSSLPTSATSQDQCIYDEYGSIFTSNKMSLLGEVPVEVEVPFAYEVETNSQYSAEEMNEIVIPNVETKLNERMLPSLFANECLPFAGMSTDRGRGIDTSVGNGNGLDGKVVGITSDPPDMTITNPNNGSVLEPCSAAIPLRPGASCARVVGSLTLYVPSDSEHSNQSDDIVSATQNVIRGVMDSGSLNNGEASAAVERVAYASDEQYLSPLEVGAISTGDDGGESRGGLPYYIAAACGAIALGGVLLILGITRRARRRDGDNAALDEIEEEGKEKEADRDDDREIVDDDDGEDDEPYNDDVSRIEIDESCGAGEYDLGLLCGIGEDL